MKLRIHSDLHVEFWNHNKWQRILELIIPPKEDDKDTTLVLAGDIGQAHKPHTWMMPINKLAERFKYVVYVEGNHFFYDNNYYGRIKLLSEVKLAENVFFLENSSVELDGILFLGATFWTSFSGSPIYMEIARNDMNDYKKIKLDNGSSLRPADTAYLHNHSKNFIFGELEKATVPTVAVTHHLPTFMSIHQAHEGDDLNHAYATEYGNLIAGLGKPNLWVHGHVHHCMDYMLTDETRIVCNPFGYMSVQENKGYQKDKEIVIC